MLPFQKQRPDKSSGANTFAWHVNFRNYAELPDTRVVRTSFFVNTISILAVVVMVLTTAYQEYHLFQLKSEVANWQRQIDDDRPKSNQSVELYKKFKTQEQKISELDAYLKLDKLVLSDFIIRLGESLPVGILLTNIELNDQAITLRGDVRGLPELASGMASAYEKQLREDPTLKQVFESVALTTLSRDSSTGKLSFVIAMKPRNQSKNKSR